VEVAEEQARRTGNANVQAALRPHPK